MTARFVFIEGVVCPKKGFGHSLELMSNGLWIQKEIRLRTRPRGIHLITEEVRDQLPEMAEVEVGVAHLLLLHTSAALSLNESVEPEVRDDMERFLDDLVPEGPGIYQHSYEGSDDMPAHIKSGLIGASLAVPITNGAFHLGTWQGIYLFEFRDRSRSRRLLATLHGSER